MQNRRRLVLSLAVLFAVNIAVIHFLSVGGGRRIPAGLHRR